MEAGARRITGGSAAGRARGRAGELRYGFVACCGRLGRAVACAVLAFSRQAQCDDACLPFSCVPFSCCGNLGGSIQVHIEVSGNAVSLRCGGRPCMARAVLEIIMAPPTRKNTATKCPRIFIFRSRCGDDSMLHWCAHLRLI